MTEQTAIEQTATISAVTDITEDELAKLPEKYSVLLNDIAAGMSYDDMALKHQRPKGTIKSRVHRARASIQKMRDRAKAAAGEPSNGI